MYLLSWHGAYLATAVDVQAERRIGDVLDSLGRLDGRHPGPVNARRDLSSALSLGGRRKTAPRQA
eukprot:1936911-Pyramimonas_sp.AAC.1